MEKKWLGIVLASIGAHIGIGFIYVKCLRRLLASRRQTFFRSIFFPDHEVACSTHFTQRHGCTSQRCKFSHNKDLAYAQFLSSLRRSKKSLDICVFIITCADIARVVTDLHDMGVIVRIISDQEQVDARGSQISKFRAAGIQVRHNSDSYLMHHKFAIVDGAVLINGSFNWTRTAISGNSENLIISNESTLVRDYRQQFNRMWDTLNPKLPG